MIFTKQASSVRCAISKTENQTLIETANRPVHAHALWCVRAGRFSEAQLLCRQLIRKCQLEGDALNFYAAQCVLSLAGSDEPFVFPSDLLVNAQDERSNLLLETNAAIHDFQSENFSAARSKWEAICKKVHSTNSLDYYTASCFTWLANSVREELAQSNHYFDSSAAELARTWAWAIKNSQKSSGRFPQEIPHSLRELAWYQVAHEHGPHVIQVLRSLRLSVLGAQRMGMANEEEKTLSAWKSMVDDLGFVVPSMSDIECERLTILAGNNAPQPKQVNVFSADETSIAKGLSDLVFALNSGVSTQRTSTGLASISSGN